MKPAIGFVPREVFSQTRNSLETLSQRTPEPLDLVCVDGHAPPGVAEYLATAAREKGFTLWRSDRYLTPNQGSSTTTSIS